MSSVSAIPRPKRKPAMARCFESRALHLAQSLFLDLGTEFSLQLLGASLKGDHLRLVSSRITPDDYSSPDEFRRDYLAASILQKYPFEDLGVDRSAVALAGFLAAEERCAATNKRLGTSYVNGVYSRLTPESILHSARVKIARLLGPFSWDQAEPFFSFGPGASISRPRREGDAYFKYREKPCATPGCAVLAYTVLSRVPRWLQHVVSLTGESMEQHLSRPLRERIREVIDLVPGNRVHFVPKDALKDRTIAIEPTMNGYIQHGIGSLLRRRLRRAHVSGIHSPRIDLDDQTRNQELSRIGSLDGSLATVDLSAASDSLSLKLCEILMPSDWYDALCICRSEKGTLPSGDLVTYQKISSMGNGYTFELESLIFWALSRAVVDLLRLRDSRVSVYGDDIVVPIGAVPTLKFILEFVGFSFNTEKSFSSGPFRESCGKHYFRGHDVTPIYVRKAIDSVPRVIWFCNQIRRWSRLPWGLDSTLHDTYLAGIELLPSRFRKPSIPDGFGDFALFGDLDEVVPRRAGRGHEGYLVDMWVPIFKTREYGDIPFLLRQLSGEGRRWTFDSYIDALRFQLSWRAKDVELTDNAYRVKDPRASLSWRLKKNVAVAKWESFGPWL